MSKILFSKDFYFDHHLYNITMSIVVSRHELLTNNFGEYRIYFQLNREDQIKHQ